MFRIFFLFVTIVLFAAAFPALAQVERFTECSEDAKDNINLAFQYLDDNMDALVNDYEFEALPREEERVRRRMRRELNDTKVHCPGKKELRCRGNSIGISGGLMTSRIHLCFTKALDEGMSFCSLVGTVAHEYAHSIGMPRDIGHNSGEIDATEMFGWFVADMCRQDNLDRPLLPVTPLTPNPSTPTQGITLYSQTDRNGRGRNFIANVNDLRQFGRNGSASSLEVLTGNWEVCQKRDFLGWCLEVHPGEIINDLRQRGINNEISAFRTVTLPRTGITLF